MNIATFEEIKLTGSLPSPAGVGVRILELTRNEDYSVEDMGKAIMVDSALTGRILHLANTGERSGSLPATTVGESIMRLGSRTVRDLALAFSLVSERTTGACAEFNYEGYWSSSLGRAVAAQAMAAKLGERRPEEAYICGLLGDVGRLALASVYADSYGEMLAEHGTKSIDGIIPKENAEFKIDHAQIGSLMQADWGLPEEFAAATLSYGSKRSLRNLKGLVGLTDCMRAAYWISEALVADEETEPIIWKRIGEQLGYIESMLGMSRNDFTRFADGIARDWVQWGKALDVSTGAGQRFSFVFDQVAGSASAQPQKVEKEETHRAKQAKREVDKNTKATARENTIRVIVIGDVASEQAAECPVLKANKQFEVRRAPNGEEGVRQTLHWGADIVLADEVGDGWTGEDICKSLRRHEQGDAIYVVVVGSPTSSSRGLKAFSAGADDFIDLPSPIGLFGARVLAGVRVCNLHRHVERDKAIMMKQVAELGVLTRKLRATSLTDALTGLPNRRYAMKRMESEWASVKRTRGQLTLLMLDVDHFKSVNDNYGHDIGDEVLKETAKTIQSAIRTSDEACRIGGEEFVIICKNTSESDSMVVAERIRKALEEHVIQIGTFNKSVTASLGVAGYRPEMSNPGELLKCADDAVYEAKRTGRNLAVAFTDISPLRKSA